MWNNQEYGGENRKRVHECFWMKELFFAPPHAVRQTQAGHLVSGKIKIILSVWSCSCFIMRTEDADLNI